MLQEKIRGILDECKTTGNWKGAAMLIANYAYEMDETIFNMQAYVSKVYGEKALDQMMDAVNELNTPPALELRIRQLEELHEYGYDKDDMFPVSEEQALERLSYGQEVHILMPDGTETLAQTEADIKDHKGYFGITQEEMNETMEALFGLEQ